MNFILLLNTKNMELLLRRSECLNLLNSFFKFFTFVSCSGCSFLPSFLFLYITPGLRLWCCCYSLGHSQVQFVTESKAGNASQVEEAAAGDGKEDAH